MNLKNQKKLVARSLKVSSKRVKLNATNPENIRQLKEVISREGVRELLETGVVSKLDPRGNSRTRANKIAQQKKKGRRLGAGSRKGTKNARFSDKDKWMIKLRALRSMLKKLRDEQRLSTKNYKDLYLKSKGNFFRNKRHLSLYIEQNNLLEEKKNDEK